MIEVLFSFAILVGGFEDMCKSTPCVPPNVVHRDLNGYDGLFSGNNPDVVSIDTKFTKGTVDSNAIMVHEFVHYLQYLKGTYHSKIKCTYPLEKQAYDVAVEFYKTHGIKKDFRKELFYIDLECRMQKRWK